MIDNIYAAKERLRNAHPNILVGFATIPIVSLEFAKNYNLEHRKLYRPMYNYTETKTLEAYLSKKLLEINTQIPQINAAPQVLRDYSTTRVKNIFLHHDTEKVTYTNKNGVKSNIRRQIQKGAFVDGVHLKPAIVEKWYYQIHKNMKAMIAEIKES